MIPTTISYFFTSNLIILLIIFLLTLLVLLINKTKFNFSKKASALIILTIIASILLIITFGTISKFNSSRSCIYCHEMNPEYQALKKTKHRNVNCLACHLSANNYTDFVFEKLYSLGEVYNHFKGDYPQIINKDSSLSQKELKSDVCLRCHSSNLKEFINKEGIKVNHKEHLENNISCTVCHNRIAHKGARNYKYLDGMKMFESCMRCHASDSKKINGEKAPSACKTCHAKEDIAKKAFNKKEVNGSDFYNCEGCHKLINPKIVKEFNLSIMKKEGGLNCDSCHSRHLSSNFDLKPDPLKCVDCHKRFLKKVENGKHGEGKKTTKKSKNVRCVECHKDHSFKKEPVKDKEKE